ncbi:hypothetical protein [Elioraea sp.]|uniref:hypothetical protein n=1 Tax=Elioraea sp. TaxID=2185103 RepID=UPI0025B8D0F8|nr:hypothetical protein [Elioraea sp.]
MSRVVSFADRARQPEQGGIVAATMLGKGAALVLGWHRDRLPRRGVASGGDGEARGPFRLTAWAHEEPGLCWFVAAIQLHGALPSPGALVTLHAQGMPDRLLSTWPAELIGARELTEEVARRATARPGDVALFLAELVEQAPRGTVLRGILRRFLGSVAVADGAVEIAGRHGTMLILQGWGTAEPGAQAVFAEGPVVRVPIALATFARPDIALPATGLVEALMLSEPWQGGVPQSLHVIADGRIRRRSLVAAPQLLGSLETAAHLAEMMKRLDADPEALASLGRAARPPYEGHETLSRAAAPLSAALDLCACIPGVGVYVAGWLLDPRAAVAGVTLCGEGGFAARLDDVWTRVARPDVVAGVSGDCRFAAIAGDAHGFAAFVSCALPDRSDGLHLAFEISGGGVAYLPVQVAPGGARALMQRIAASIDLHKPTGLSVVEAQLSPLLATAAMCEAGTEATILRAPRASRTALILPLPEPEAPPAAMLSPFLNDPPVPGEEELVLVLGPAWRGPALTELLAVIDLCGLSPAIMIAEERISIAEAWEIGAAATRAPLLLCLPGTGLAAATGWRQALVAALPEGGENDPRVIVPTLLYEDGSVRSTGFDQLIASDAPPYLRLRRPHAGMPQAAIPAGDRADGAMRRGAVLAGALVTREAHRRGGGFARFGLRTPAQETGFFLRLADAGGICSWHGDIAVVAPEAKERGPAWHDAARLAEGHALRALWGGAGR